MIGLDSADGRTAIRVDSVSIVALLASLFDAVSARRSSSIGCIGCIRCIIDGGIETACSTIESIVARTDTG